MLIAVKVSCVLYANMEPPALMTCIGTWSTFIVSLSWDPVDRDEVPVSLWGLAYLCYINPPPL